MWYTFRQKIFLIMDGSDRSNRLSIFFNLFISILILCNITAVILETSAELAAKYSDYFEKFEIFSITVFTIELILRIITSSEDKKFEGIKGKLKFLGTPGSIIDILAIIPFYLPMLFSFDLRFIRILRLLRLMRIFKLGRYSSALNNMGNVFATKKEELIITLISVFILLIISSSLMYIVESEHQPDAFSSIPSTMWWAVATLTTVGYGDIFPITPLGKFLGAIISILGVGLFALPAGIIASGFAETMKKKKSELICPHCGNKFHIEE